MSGTFSLPIPPVLSAVSLGITRKLLCFRLPLEKIGTVKMKEKYFFYNEIIKLFGLKKVKIKFNFFIFYNENYHLD